MENKIQEKEKIKTESTIHNFDNIPIVQVVAGFIIHYFTEHCESITTRAQLRTTRLSFLFKLVFILFLYSNLLSYSTISQFLQFFTRYLNFLQLQQFFPQSTSMEYGSHLGTNPAHHCKYTITVFVLSTPSIGADFTSIHCISCYLSHIQS